MNMELAVSQADEHAQLAHEQTDNNVLTLETLTIADCGGVFEAIKQKLTAGLTVLLDISQCQEIDTAGVQLLAAIQIDPAVNLKVHWTKPSELVSMKAQRLGLLSWINAGFLEN
ncbi:STAS domain-containing protein [Limnobacter humi]|uniref:STAS domain-containing protein n=1 Tax=Limnobacter humi TaxID=1778671 RepID=A0ABT1WJT1_9BURK|nr:STAS domain-containing protein [Limnobacter humi]MCQ8897775.1 STAS domain-containing protein [Limnobacter humi]